MTVRDIANELHVEPQQVQGLLDAAERKAEAFGLRFTVEKTAE